MKTKTLTEWTQIETKVFLITMHYRFRYEMIKDGSPSIVGKYTLENTEGVIKICLVCPDLSLLIFVCLLFSFVVVVVFCVCGLWEDGGWEVVGSSRVGRWLEAVGLCVSYFILCF